LNVRIKIDKEIFNKIYRQFLNCTIRTQIFFGGSSSGKSYFLAQRTILDVLTGRRNYLICRNTAVTIKKSVFNEITKAISNMKVRNLFTINRTDMTITCINGYQILFAGLDDVEKIKSVTPIKDVITDVWIEEATEITYKAYKQLKKRLRGKTDVIKRVILSFNPIYKQHWIFDEFFLHWDETKEIQIVNNVLIVKTTYKHNAFLSKDDIIELESETDQYYFQVYTLGNFGIIGNVIFKNWEQRDLSEERKTFGLIESGLDFGWTHPNAYLRMHYNKNAKTLYILDEVYVNNVNNDQLAELMHKKYEQELIVGDSEAPLQVKEMFRLGFRIVGAHKPKGSVEYGYKWLLKQKIVVDTSCTGTIKELNIHKHKEDKNGNPLNIPEDKNNDCIAAMRYGMEYQMKESSGAGVY
jgi:phage terminase large subunit